MCAAHVTAYGKSGKKNGGPNADAQTLRLRLRLAKSGQSRNTVARADSGSFEKNSQSDIIPFYTTMPQCYLVSEIAVECDNSGRQISSDISVCGVFTTDKLANDAVLTWHERE